MNEVNGQVVLDHARAIVEANEYFREADKPNEEERLELKKKLAEVDKRTQALFEEFANRVNVHEAFIREFLNGVAEKAVKKGQAKFEVVMKRPIKELYNAEQARYRLKIQTEGLLVFLNRHDEQVLLDWNEVFEDQ